MSFKTFGAHEQLELARLAKAGDRDALAELLDSQNGLIRQVALVHARQGCHLEMDDLIQEGSLAVMDAAKWFNPDRGYLFSTYAGDCIRRRLYRYVTSVGVAPIGIQEPDRVKGSFLHEMPEDEPEDVISKLKDVLKKLPPIDRATIMKRHKMGGKQLGLQRKTELRRYKAACAALREAAGASC